VLEICGKKAVVQVSFYIWSYFLDFYD